MLRRIAIRGLAVIDAVELDFGPGLTVLTGETGAGKSILVDALGLVLGDRADTDMVRAGRQRAEVDAEFDLADCPAARDFLVEQGLDSEDECILRRLVEAEGRSRALVNGRSVPVATLRALGEHLVDIHGQHEHQSLVRRSVQRDILDHHADLLDQREALARHHRSWREAAEALEAMSRAREDRDARLDLLRYQLKELEALEPQPGEVEELGQRQRRLANQGRLMEAAQLALDASFDQEDAAAHSRITRATRALEEVAEIEPALAGPLDLLRQAEIQVSEAADGLRHYLADAELDPAELEQVDERLGAMHQLARKHRVDPEALPELMGSLRHELAELEDADVRIETLRRELDAAETAYREAATAISEARMSAAAKMSERISGLMGQLGMDGGRFEVSVDHEPEAEPRADGLDRIEFQVTANPGQPPRPMAKVASGGELSRIGLAVQVVAAEDTTIPVLVFDEVDAGIGGGVAEIVGRQLRGLGGARQCLCVTHLPQVASQAHQHVRVSKTTDGSETRTSLSELAADARVEELGRMLGGVELTEQTLAHAREMLEKARS